MKALANSMNRSSFLALAVFALAAEMIWAQPNNPASWKTLAEGGAVVELSPDTVSPLPGAQATNTLRIAVKQTGQLCGIACADTGITKLAAGQWYDVSFNSRTDPPKTFALVVSLESLDGKKVFARTTLPEVGGDQWGRFSVALHVREPATECRMVITLADTGTLWLNDITVVLRPAAGAR